MAELQTKGKRYTDNLNENIYSRAILSRRIQLDIINVGKNAINIIEKMLSSELEGKCTIEGFVRPKSVKILSISSGLVESAFVVYDVTIECFVASPVEGMIINCISKNVTKAGIRAETGDNPSPVVIFIAREHHLTNKHFTKVKEGDNISVKVIGQRYELNDNYISIIAELVEQKKDSKKQTKKLVLKNKKVSVKE